MAGARSFATLFVVAASGLTRLSRASSLSSSTSVPFNLLARSL